MKMKMIYAAVRAIALVAMITLLAGVSPQMVQAQLIAYEGFDYVDVAGASELATVGGGALGTGTGWLGGQGWFGDADPDRIVVVDEPGGWGYTDSQLNQLDTTGRALEVTDWDNVSRRIDLAGVDSGLLYTDPSGNFPSRLGKIGAGGTEIWISFLGQGTELASTAELQIVADDNAGGVLRKKMSLGRPWKMGLDGVAPAPDGNNNAWGAVDFKPGLPDADEFYATGDSYLDKVFFVARIEFEDESASNPLGNETVTVWTNPDLGSTAPSEASAKISDFTSQTNFVLSGFIFNGSADTYFDELRVGMTYGDVAPIAAGQDGDFDGDLDVDGADFLKWQRELGDAASLVDWQSEFGTVAALSTVSAVPEPSSLMLACTIMAFIGRFRPSRSS